MGKLSNLRGGIEKASKALDMSSAAGEARALDQGFADKNYYHATLNDFDAFDKNTVGDRFDYSFGHHLTDRPDEANMYASDSISNAYNSQFPSGSRVIPARVRYENPLVIDTDHIAASMEADRNREGIMRQLDEARASGSPYDAVVIRRTRGDEYDGENVIVFDPAQIRSQFAAFDPAKKDSSNLLASMGGAAVLGGAALAPEDAEAGVFGKIIKAGVNTSKKAADEYSAGHTAPYRDADGYHPQLDNVEPMYGEDIYGRQAKNLYGYEDGSNESIDIIQRMRGKPDAEVDIYRAVPAGVNEFNQRDWVTLSKRYAREHGDSNIEGRYDILKGKAKASDLFNEGYPAEWGIDVLDVAKKYGISTVLAGSVLAGTMTPEQAQAATGLENFTQRRAAKRDYWKQLKSTMLEGMAGVNRGLVDTLNFVGPDQVNAVLQLSGSDNRIPTFSDIPGVQQATQGGYMEPGTARDVVRTGSEFLSPL